MVRALLILLAAVALAGGPARAQSPAYSEWRNPDAQPADGRLQEFIGKLNALIDEAEKARAADPDFLRDLRDLAGGLGRPGRARLFADDFLDGNHTHNPAWRVVSGKYWVERGWGLRSSAENAGGKSGQGQGARKLSDEEKAVRIFGQILGQALNQGRAASSKSGPASTGDAVIVSAAKISNAFAWEADLSSWNREGRLYMAVYQGEFKGPKTPGYRLAYAPGGTFELLRVSSRGTGIIERAKAPYALEDKKIHRLIWERRRDGRMTVAVDGQVFLKASDRGFGDPFDGVALVNTGGDYIVKRISVMGTRQAAQSTRR